jgi:hypothetical protein
MIAKREDNTMKTVTVAAHKYDPRAVSFRKFDNLPDVGWIRPTTPDVSQLSPLAVWLVEHSPQNVAGRMPHPQKEFQVRLFSGKTNRSDWSDAQIRAYGAYADMPQQIDDYLFPIIQPGQSDEDYWNTAATLIQKIGAVRVAIGAAEMAVAQ